MPSQSSSAQSPLTPAYQSLTGLLDDLCAMSPAPSTWLTAYYEPVSGFCSNNVC